jgi:hypothetical protein
MLGVADPERLRQAQALDHAAEQLVADASAEQQSRPGHLAELAASVREIPQYWREAGVRGGILIRSPASAARDGIERQAE